MTGDSASSGSERFASDDRDIIRRRILVRAQRRGMRELDIILGGFAKAHSQTLGPEDLAAFEALLDAPDGEVFQWFCAGEAPAPHDTPLFCRIVAFCANNGATP